MYHYIEIREAADVLHQFLFTDPHFKLAIAHTRYATAELFYTMWWHPDVAPPMKLVESLDAARYDMYRIGLTLNVTHSVAACNIARFCRAFRALYDTSLLVECPPKVKRIQDVPYFNAIAVRLLLCW